MQVVIVKSEQQVAKYGARYCAEFITQKSNAVLGLATGSTPLSLYQELINKHINGDLSFSSVRSFNLDEYIGIPEDHPQSYRYFMNHNLFDFININKDNTHIPIGIGNPHDSALEYEKRLKNIGGIDLQILGIGSNGHIGFNEPSSSLASRTRVKTLTSQTMKDNSRFFKEDEFQPSLAITMGIATIMEAKQVLLLATGESKAKAVKDFIEGPLSASCPASALQMHANTKVIIDEQAAKLLEHKEYYLQVKLETELLENTFV
jgi:glucosamine-6-phosphate deaminase